MRKYIKVCLAFFVMIISTVSVNAQSFQTPDLAAELAPYTSDQINLIIMMLCVSGTALILLLVLSILQKNKKK